jgi:hypothetical protein
MKTKLTLIALTALMVSTGCATTVRVGRPTPPPPPPVVVAQPMTYNEAVQLGLSYAHQRGFNANVQEAHMTGNQVWKVKLNVFRGPESGKLKLDYDAYSRALLRADEKVKVRGHGHKHASWDDDDDDDREDRVVGHRASAANRDDDDKKNKSKKHGASAVANK